MLALPYALARAGLFPGLLLCALFCLAEAFTLYTLAKFAERYRARTYGQLVRRALGKRSAALLSLSVFLLQWGACVAYLVIIGDAFGGVIEAAVGAAGGGGGRSGDGLGGAMGMVGGHGGGKRPPAPPPPPPPPHADNPYRTPALLAVALGVVFPLCLPADLAALEAVSAAAVAGFAFTSFVVVLRGWQRAMARPAAERFSHVRAWRPAAGGRGLLDAVPVAAGSLLSAKQLDRPILSTPWALPLAPLSFATSSFLVAERYARVPQKAGVLSPPVVIAPL